MIDIIDCRITWLKPFGKKKGRLRVQHMPTGHEVERETELRDDWGLDSLLAKLNTAVADGQSATWGKK